MSSLNGQYTPSVFVPDGYTLNGKVDARPGLWPEVRFRYRPALHAAANDYLAQPRRNGDEATDADVALVVRHVQSWDAASVDQAGLAVSIPLKPDILRKVHHGILTSMVNHVLGYTSPQQEADLKNSDTASG